MNVAIQTEDDEQICLFTSSLKRAKKVCLKGNVNYTDIYEVKDEEMQYYCFDDKIFDPKYIKNK